jgi:protein O-GlcNAc transferase
MTLDLTAIHTKFQEGFACHQKGQIPEARRIYDEVLALAPQHFDALHFAGVLAAQAGDYPRAVDMIGRALAINPGHAGAHYNLGVALSALKRFEPALAAYDKTIALVSTHPGAHHNRGAALQALGQPQAALEAYDRALALKPDYVEAYFNRGMVLRDLGRFDEAVAAYDRALGFDPRQAAAHFSRGIALLDLKRSADAVAAFDKALALKPAYVEALFSRGAALKNLGRMDEALASFDKIIEINPNLADVYNERGLTLLAMNQPQAALVSFSRAVQLKQDFAEAYANHGVALRALGRLAEAVESYDRAIALKPDQAGIHNNRGTVLADLRRCDEALAGYDRALALNPAFAEAYNNRAVALAMMNRPEDAAASYREAIRLQPDLIDAHNNLANLLVETKQHEAAIAAYDAALAINPAHAYAHGMRLHTRMFICQWQPHDHELATLAGKIIAGEKAAPPFPAVTLISPAPLLRQVTETWTRDQHPANPLLGPIAKRAYQRGDKIRVAYFSADYKNHPVALLAAGLFEEHDRDRFEVYGFSLGPDTRDDMRQRVEKAFDKFFNVHGKSDRDIAQLARINGIDIAVDLSGHTGGARTNVFALRAAPIQVNYLGYPGTMGADYMDYIVADETAIPAEDRIHYAEKVVWMPGSYQVNDAKRRISGQAQTRAEHGLPDTGVVFCCFNNTYKITPAVFDTWMDILKQVKGSVLWLFKDNAAAAENLRKEANRRGIHPSRLIFAERMDVAHHLARHRVADLFLDTLPYNAHTTGSDALWAGLPLLTCLGESFAGRVAAGLLKSVGLPELITTSRQDYRDLAVALGNDPASLAALKEKLDQNRYSAPLFDAAGFARHIEDAYRQMHNRYRNGEAPDHIAATP